MLNFVRRDILIKCCACILAITTIAATTADRYRISYSDKVTIKNNIQQTALHAVESVLRSAGVNSTQEAVVVAEFTVDESGLQRDAAAFVRNAEEDYQRRVREIETHQRAAIKELQTVPTAPPTATPTAVPTKTYNVRTQDGARFGVLNLGMNENVLKDALDRPASETAPTPAPPQMVILNERPAVSLSLGTQEPFVAPVFTYDPIDYVRNLTLEVSLPHDAPKKVDALVKKKVVQSLLVLAPALNLTDGVKLVHMSAPITPTPSPTPIPTKPPSALSIWLKAFTNPEHGSVFLLMSALAFGMFILLATTRLAKVFNTIARNIGEMKPKEESKDTGAEETLAILNANTEEDVDLNPNRRTYDAAASNQALTSEMKTIRDQLQEVIAKNEQVCAELIRDLYYESTGMEDFRALLGFVGFESLRPALLKLPRSIIEEIMAYIEDSRHEPANVLHGVEVAQRLYRDTVSKMTMSNDNEVSFDRVRASLVSVDDKVLSTLIVTASPLEVAVILNATTIERSNKIMKDVPKDRLREVFALLDKRDKQFFEAADNLASKLEELQGNSAATSSQKQKRMVLRLVKSATIDDEESFSSLVAPDDWEMRYAMMETKFFFKDLVYAEPKFLRTCIDSLGARIRADFLSVCGEALRNHILSAYPEGSKLSEMIMDELASIDKNAKRKTEVEGRRRSIIDLVMQKIRPTIVADKSQLNKVVENQCRVLGLKPPGSLNEETRAA